MREQWRALAPAGAARPGARTPGARWGCCWSRVGYLRFPLFAWFLKMMADGVVRARPAAPGRRAAAGIAATRVLWFVGRGTGAGSATACRVGGVRAGPRDRHAHARRFPGWSTTSAPTYQDRLELLRQQQGMLGNSLNTLIFTANTVVIGHGHAGGAGAGQPVAAAAGALRAGRRSPSPPCSSAGCATRKTGSAAVHRRARHLQALTVDRNAGMELRVFGLQREILAPLPRGLARVAGAMVLAARRRGRRCWTWRGRPGVPGRRSAAPWR